MVQPISGALPLRIYERKQREKDTEELIEDLYKQIGKQKVANDWLKKKIGIIEDDISRRG